MIPYPEEARHQDRRGKTIKNDAFTGHKSRILNGKRTHKHKNRHQKQSQQECSAGDVFGDAELENRIMQASAMAAKCEEPYLVICKLRLQSAT